LILPPLAPDYTSAVATPSWEFLRRPAIQISQMCIPGSDENVFEERYPKISKDGNQDITKNYLYQLYVDMGYGILH